MRKELITVLFLLFIIAYSTAQDSEILEAENGFGYNWQAKIFMGIDFFPFKFNERINYSTEFDFSISGGVLSSSDIDEGLQLSSGLIYARKDHSQSLECVDCGEDFFGAQKIETQLRYVEIPLTLKKYVISTEVAGIYATGGLLGAVMYRANSIITNRDGEPGSNPTNFGYKRLLYGLYAGLGFEALLTEQWSFGVESNLKFYLSDLSNDNLINLSSTGFLFSANYHFE